MRSCERVRHRLPSLALLCAFGGASIAHDAAATDAASTAHATAIVTDIEGSVRRVGAAGGHAVSLFDAIGSAQAVVVAPQARVEIVLTGAAPRVASVRGPCRFVLQPDRVVARTPECAVEIRELALPWHFVQVLPGVLGRASVSLRDGSAGLVPARSPSGAQLPDALRQLRWGEPYGRAGSHWRYRIRLVDPQGEVLFAADTRAQQIDLPPLPPWTRGQDYLWTVEANSDEGRRVEAAAEFHVVDMQTEARMRELAALVDAARARADEFAATQELLFALALDAAQLSDAAQAHWRALARVRPALGPLLPMEPSSGITPAAGSALP